MDEGTQQDQHDRALLAQYRANLRHLEGQAAGYGSERQLPVHVMNQLGDARKDIADLKQRMRARGAPVADDPGDWAPAQGSSSAVSKLPSLTLTFVFTATDVVSEQGDLLATLLRAISAFEHAMPVTFHIQYQPFRDQAHLLDQPLDPTLTPADQHIQTQAYDQALRDRTIEGYLTQAVPILFGTIAAYGSVSPAELISVVHALPQMSRTQYADGRIAFDVYRPHPPRLGAVVYADARHCAEIVEKHGERWISTLTGSGWDLFDLPRTLRVAALPAMIMEVLRINADSSLDAAVRLMDFNQWAIGVR